MTRDELLALAARVQALTGPLFLIEQEIADAVGHDPRARLPNYTTSIDAAQTLVPEGYIWTLYSDGGAVVEPCDDNPVELADGTIWAATPALALTAAALRAQAVLMEGRDG